MAKNRVNRGFRASFLALLFRLQKKGVLGRGLGSFLEVLESREPFQPFLVLTPKGPHPQHPKILIFGGLLGTFLDHFGSPARSKRVSDF